MAKAKNEVKNEKYGAMDGFFESQEQERPKREMNPASLQNLSPRKSGTVQQKAYMQLNVYECEDYIYRMSKVQHKTMTGYVLDLIKQDMARNQQAYEGLKLIKELDKPARVAKNKKSK